MDSEHKKAEEVIFYRALELTSPAERATYVKEACGHDSDLLERVRALLEVDGLEDGFLVDPPTILDIPTPSRVLTEAPGTIIGRYKLLERIGEGGMAVVYMAEQEEPIRRKVALKIIKVGMDTRQVIARFEAERQALAMMDHPCIAKVHDAGATETGRPYFVMELVQGVSITEYCDRNSLSTRDRLDLFIQVCHAVQHAHQKGIIHRDLKPSNVMVTHHDGKPVPKVIDFGIAKATNQKLTEKTLFTHYAHIIGTPAYMSPEQAELSDLDIDTRTDIYSLGVLLYELLTGTTPFSEEELRKAGYIEMQRLIREQEPVKPSTRIRTALRRASVPARRSSMGVPPTEGHPKRDLSRLGSASQGHPGPGSTGETPVALMGKMPMLREVRGDLDWIVMKSLEKVRDKRYDTVSALAMDVQRYLNVEPILARAPSAMYRLRKFLRRHRLSVVGGLMLAVLAAALAIAFATWNQGRVRLVEAEAIRHRDVLSEANLQYTRTEYEAALERLSLVLGSRHVGTGARLLEQHIQEAVRGRIVDYTREIEGNPQNAGAYSHRARYYACLGDRARANADMRQWSTILNQGALPDSPVTTPRRLRGVINGPLAYQLVFSVGRRDNGILILVIAFGQKGRCDMRVFEIPMLAMSLFGYGLLLSVDTPAAQAAFTFGTPVNVETTIPVLDPAHECIDCLSYDGLEMYINSDRPGGQGDWDEWVLKRASKDDPWGPPENLGPAVNSSGTDSGATISADGLALYFHSGRPGGYGGADIYMTTRATRNAPWGPPVNLGPKVNSSVGDGSPRVSADGLELYFSSWRPGGYGAGDIYVARRATPNDPWGNAVNLGPAVNSAYDEGLQALSPDGLLFFFSDNFQTSAIPRPGGYGGSDIWMTRRASISSPWQAPVNLGPRINGPAHDLIPVLSPEGSTLYFTTCSNGTWANWQAQIVPVVDFSADGKVDLVDLVILIDNWGTDKTLCDIGPYAWGDGKVDIEDLKVFMAEWEKQNPPAQP